VRWINFVVVLLINAVPLVGIRYFGWLATTVVILYWWENLLTAVFTCARIAVHRHLTRKRGHWRGGVLGMRPYDAPQTQPTLLGEYGQRALFGVLAWGVIIGVIGLEVSGRGDPSWELPGKWLGETLASVFAAKMLEFLLDVPTLRTRSFAWIKAYAGQRLGQALVMGFIMFLGLVGAMGKHSPWAIFQVPWVWLYLMIASKAAWDLAQWSTTGKHDPAEKAAPLRWLFWLINPRVDDDYRSVQPPDPDEMFIVVKEDEEVVLK
jgi:hypothetical protein